MNLYILLYISIIVISIFIGFLFYKKYKNSEGKYFIILIIMLSLWLFLYLLSFSTTYNKDILLLYSRIMYPVSLIGMYGMILFITNFSNNKVKNNRIYYSYIFSGLFLLIISIFTPYIIDDMLYDEVKKIYYEDYGIFYGIFILLYILFIPLLTIIYFFKIKKINNSLNKVRLKFIFFGFISFIFSILFFLVLLPLFGVRLFEKEIIIFFLPFIFSVWYVIYRYNFLDIKILLGKIINFIFSLSISVFFITFGRYYFTNILDNRLVGFWGISSSIGLIDLILGILIFISFYSIFENKILGEIGYVKLTKKISQMKKKISFISNFSYLNLYLNIELGNIIKSNYVNINLINNSGKDLEGLQSYFNKDKLNNIFINDIVFIEENRNKFDYELIKAEISKKTYLVFPLINNKGEFIGVFEIGYKIFKDIYTKEEVDILRDIVDFLVGHLKYIEIYSEINELNINLDKKVDEKTIQYNELVNRQNEFIGIVSHEIKTPLSTSIFQVDSLIDDIKEGEDSIEYVKGELLIIEKQLEKISDLTNSLFVNQRYDLGKIELFKESINFEIFLDLEVETFRKKFSDIDFKVDISDNIGEILLDKVQFTQVISNLITNAIKFADKNKKIISIKAYLENSNLIIDIEDNGKGFGDIDTNLIFDKYNTGNKISVGIGMGLYLCDKIVGLHGGSIKVTNSKYLGGAKFQIILNKN